MRLSVFLISLLATNGALAEDKTYFAASSEVLGGGGFDGLTMTSIGFETAVGQRLSRFLVIEGSFSTLVDVAPYQLPPEGAMCSGESTDQFHWHTFGVRLWVRAVHSRHIDFSIAPPAVAAGAVFTHERPLVPPTGSCSYLKPHDLTNGLFVLDFIRLALEVRLNEHFAWRLMAGVELELPLALSVYASTGPVFRF